MIDNWIAQNGQLTLLIALGIWFAILMILAKTTNVDTMSDMIGG